MKKAMSFDQFEKDPTPSYLDKFYKIPQGFSWSYDTITGYTEFVDKRRLTVVADVLDEIEVEKIWDLGCGGGAFLRELSERGHPVGGFDINLNLLGKIKEDHFQLLNTKVEEIPFRDNSMPCVLCCDVLEHIYNLNDAIKEIRRVLEGNGLAIITVPNLFCYDSLEGRFGILTKIIGMVNYFRRSAGRDEIYKFGYNTHIHKNTVNVWKNILESSGLRVICSKPIFISPYIPRIFSSLKRLEKLIYDNHLLFGAQGLFEKALGRFFPFNKLGQCHLFVCKKQV